MQIIEAIRKFKQQFPAIFIGIAIVIFLLIGSLLYVAFSRDDSMNLNTLDRSEETASTSDLLETFSEGEISLVCDYVLTNGNAGRGYFKPNNTYSLEQYTNLGTYRLIKLEKHGYIWRTNQESGFKIDSKAWNNQYNSQVPIFDTKTMEVSVKNVSKIECEQPVEEFDEDLFTPASDKSFSNPQQVIEAKASGV